MIGGLRVWYQDNIVCSKRKIGAMLSKDLIEAQEQKITRLLIDYITEFLNMCLGLRQSLLRNSD